MRNHVIIAVLAALIPSSILLTASPIPLHLPHPDDDAGNPEKPVQVFILAGQSNMVGMGDISGARPYFESIFLSADPDLITGRLSDHGLKRHGVYQADEADAPEGAIASLYKGAYDKENDYIGEVPIADTHITLGTVSETLPGSEDAYTVVVRGYIDVPASGTYTIHPGYEDSTYAIAILNGEEAYRREVGEEPQSQPMELQAGHRYPLTVTYKKSPSEAMSAAFWMRQINIPGRGDLETITKVDGLFPYLLDDDGDWTVRKDVYYKDVRLGDGNRHGFLSPLSNGGRSVGPEVGLGHVLGYHEDAQVLLIKSAQGNRTLGFDFRPPSSGRLEPDNENEGYEYRRMIEGVRRTLDNIENFIPDYQGQGYELAGFAWWQGHGDRFDDKMIETYEENLANLINDVREEFDVPDLPAVVATVAFNGYNLTTHYQSIFESQMAVADPQRHPDFAGNVTTVDTRDFVREVRESPRAEGHHYHRNAETYMLVGEAMGRAMVELLGGEAEPIPLSGRKEKAQAETEEPDEPTEAEKAAGQIALQPIIRYGLARETIANIRDDIAPAYRGEPNNNAMRAMKELVRLYNTVGIHEYDWEPFGPHRTEMEWDYHTFDPEEQPEEGRERHRLGRYREVTYPDGMEDWHKPDFDAEEAGWQRGLAPFASIDGELKASGSCTNGFCGCGEEPNTLWENEVLLKRGTFEMPPLEDGYMYRILIGGMSHVGAGDGARVYLNGEEVYARDTAVERRMGGRPIGTVIDHEMQSAFENGDIHLAATSFLKYYPRSGVYGNYMTVFLQRMKLPPIDL